MARLPATNRQPTTGPRHLRWARRAITVSVMVVFAIVTVSCGGDDDDPDAIPRADSATFGEGEFDDIPLVEGSEQIGPTSVAGDGVMTATWSVSGLTPTQIIEELADDLQAAGWTVLVQPVERPEGAIRTEWTDDDRRLEVVATTIDGTDGGGTTLDAQYSLLLHPDIEDADVDADRDATTE